MRVLVTGGAGFIGSHLIARLLEGRHQVTGIDDLSAKGPARQRAHALNRESIIVSEHDVRNIRPVLRCLPYKPDAIVHLAAPISVPESIENPAKYRDAITVATHRLLDCAREERIMRVVIASTAAVYGNPRRMPVREDDALAPLSPYAHEKLVAENLAKAYAKEHNLETVMLRIFNVYGPGQDPSSHYSGVVSKFMEQVVQNKPPVIFGDGTQTRDLVYVGDVADAIIAGLEHRVEPGLIVNIGSGSAITINGLARAIIRLSGNDLQPRYAPPREGDIKHSQADISKARQELDYSPRVSLEEGLRRTWDWFTAERKY